MITRRTKVQLLVFVVITLIGVSYVGARYARLDRLILDDTYTVVAHFADSGGIFAGGEVTYRGVKVGQVERARADRRGRRRPPRDRQDYDDDPGRRDRPGRQPLRGRRAVRRAAAAERRRALPRGRLRDRGREHPHPDPDPDAAHEPVRHRRVCRPGRAAHHRQGVRGRVRRHRRGPQRIIDTGNAFIEDANDNFDVTTAPDPRQQRGAAGPGRQGRARSAPSPATLALFSGTLAGSDGDLREVIDDGSVAANELRTFLEDNEVELGELINNLVTTGEVVVSTSTASSRCWWSTRTSSRAASPWCRSRRTPGCTTPTSA